MKSIKTKLSLYFGILLSIICLVLSITAYVLSNNALSNNTKTLLAKTSAESSKVIESRLNSQLNILEAIAQRDQFKDPSAKLEDKLAILKTESARCGFDSIGVGNLEGDLATTAGAKINLKDRPYYQAVLSGNRQVTDPIISKVDGALIVNYAVPVKDNTGKVIGAIIGSRNGNELSTLTNDIVIGNSGTAFVLTKTGNTIASNDPKKVSSMENIIELSAKDPSLNVLAEAHKKIISGENGYSEYTYNGVNKYVGYAPIKGTNWSLAIAVPKGEILNELNSLKTTLVIVSILIMLCGLATVYMFSKVLSKGVISISSYLNTLSKGDFSIKLPEKLLNLNDEIGTAFKSMLTMQESIKEMITVIKEKSLNIDNNTSILNEVAQNMTKTSENVSCATQETTKGINDQANGLVNITELLNTFGSKLDTIESDVKTIDSNSNDINKMAITSNDTMHTLMNSVNVVSNSFSDFIKKVDLLSVNISQISGITNLINEIAEQTNLLALNAAIEAARAGEAGKGFAVVADEIRKLAEQSKDSSEKIDSLITNISKDANLIIGTSNGLTDELENQVTVINSTLDSYKQILEAINKIALKIQSTHNSVTEINKEKSSILETVESASAVAEEVSASSEEIAASAIEMNSSSNEVSDSSEKLNTMTKEMINEVNKFKI